MASRVSWWLVLVLVLSCACGGDDGSDGPDPGIDASVPDAASAECQMANSRGGFPTCDVCDAIGTDCDTIDVNGQVSRHCGCTGGCPCGLSCGSIEIAPGVVVSGICVR